MRSEIAANIVDKYLGGTASVEEIAELDTWYSSFDSLADLYVPGSIELNHKIAEMFSALKVKLEIVDQYSK